MNTDWMVGRSIEGVTLEPSFWVFHLAESAYICVECPWRIVSEGSIVVSGDDHNKAIGYTRPIDAARTATTILHGEVIEHVRVDEDTSDLRLVFRNGKRLEITPMSSIFESWSLRDPFGNETYVLGGGKRSEGAA